MTVLTAPHPSSSRSLCFPGRDDMHLWITRLDEVPRQYGSALFPVEWERARRFHFERDREQFIVARATLRHVLSSYLGTRAADLAFEFGAYGKPQLNDTSLAFNLSHSGNLMLLGIAQEREVGVDVEEVRDTLEVEMHLDQYFSPDDASEVLSRPVNERDAAFFQLWTRTEACLKAAGLGINEGLRAADPERWSVEHFSPAAGYAAAVAIEGKLVKPLDCWSWPR